MKQIWLLSKVQFGNVFDFNKILTGKLSNRKNIALITALALVLLLSITSFFYSYTIGSTLKMVGRVDLLPELVMAITCLITITTTIYKVKGTLFGFKDYDLIMALPVKTERVVASRLMLLYIINITFTLIIMVPAYIAYGVLAGADFYFYAAGLLTLFFIPVIPMIIAAVIGTVIAVIASRFRHSNLFNVVFTFAIMIGIMAAGILEGDSEEKFGEVSAALAKQVDQIYPLAGMYRSAVCDLDIISILLFLFISVFAFSVFAWITGIKFKAINTSIAAARTKGRYKIGELNQASPLMALYRKELRRLFSSSLYIMNTTLGVIMMTIGAAVSFFLSPEYLEQITGVPQMQQLIGGFLPIVVNFCVVMTFTAACAISLEGKNIWILKTAPVSVNTIFLSKIAVNLTVTLPAVFLTGILFAAGFKLTLADTLILLVMPSVYAVFTGVSGLVINLSFPNLNWTTEVTVIKQSAASLAAMFSGLLAAALPAVLIFMLPAISPLVINISCTLLIFMAALILYRYLNTKGITKFQLL